MEKDWLQAEGAKPDLVRSFVQASGRLGFDPSSLIQQHVERGIPVELPEDLLGECASVDDVTVPTFDPGFDRQASADTGVITGVDPSGAAYAAGLRNGMKRIERLSGREGDARIAMGYRVKDEVGERDIAWLPAGSSTVQVQQVTVRQNLNEAGMRACISKMSGHQTP